MLPDPEDDEFVLWWDAELAWQIFMDVASPWKFGMDGITGIDDLALIAVLQLHPIRKAARLDVLRDVQSAARGALKYINEQREKQLSR